MTRATEFCYIAEVNGHYLMALGGGNPMFTENTDLALRVTAEGRIRIAAALSQMPIGFRKVLVG